MSISKNESARFVDKGAASHEVWWETAEYLEGIANPPQPPELDEREASIFEEIRDMVGEGEFDLPPLPVTTTKVMDLISQDDVDFQDVSQVIKTDQVLAAEVLKVVNSTVYGGYARIADLDLAVARLGRMPLRSVILGVSMKLTMRHMSRAELSKKLWEHSVACSTISQSLARGTGKAVPTDAFLAGLLHDIGTIAVIDAINEVERAHDTTLRSEIVELACSELHESAGLFVAKLWNLPQGVTPAITNHHSTDPEKLNSPLVAIVTLAELLCHALAIGVDRVCVDPLASAPVQVLGLTPAEAASAMVKAEQDMQKTLANLPA